MTISPAHIQETTSLFAIEIYRPTYEITEVLKRGNLHDGLRPMLTLAEWEDVRRNNPLDKEIGIRPLFKKRVADYPLLPHLLR